MKTVFFKVTPIFALSIGITVLYFLFNPKPKEQFVYSAAFVIDENIVKVSELTDFMKSSLPAEVGNSGHQPRFFIQLTSAPETNDSWTNVTRASTVRLRVELLLEKSGAGDDQQGEEELSRILDANLQGVIESFFKMTQFKQSYGNLYRWKRHYEGVAKKLSQMQSKELTRFELSFLDAMSSTYEPLPPQVTYAEGMQNLPEMRRRAKQGVSASLAVLGKFIKVFEEAIEKRHFPQSESLSPNLSNFEMEVGRVLVADIHNVPNILVERSSLKRAPAKNRWADLFSVFFMALGFGLMVWVVLDHFQKRSAS